MEQCEAIIITNERVTPDIVRLTLSAPSMAHAAKPGQFVNVKVGGNTLDPLLRRPFSIHQTSVDGTLQILFKVLGKGTEALSKAVPGSPLNLVGPLGNSFAIGEAMCLIGGGMGIAPLLFLARTIKESHPTSALSVILGARTKGELLPFAQDFESLAITPYLATDDGSAGHHGIVTDLMPRVAQENQPWQVATCGPYPMMRQVAANCREYGWPCQVSLETMMACGIKACLGCTVPASNENSKGAQYLHVCQDGPVFSEGDIQWK